MTVSLLRFRFAVVTLALAPPVSAAEPVSLDPVTITGTRTPVTAEELPTGTVILYAEDLEEMPATNLADALDSVAGINTRRTFGIDGNRASVDMLGFGATGGQNTLVLLNGHRYSNVDLAAPDLESIPMAAIERIEILPGSGAALYGNGAVGGVINIVTRKGYDNRAGVSLSDGSYNLVEGKAWATGSRGDFSGAAAVDALNSEGYRDNNDHRQRNGFLDFRADLDKVDFYLTSTAEDQRLELPGYRDAAFNSDDTEFENDPRGTDSPNDWAAQETLTLTPGVVLNLADGMDFHLELSARDKEQAFFFDDPMFPFYGETDIDTRSIAPRFTVGREFSGLRHDLTLGWDHYEYDYDNRSAASESQIGNPSSTKEVEQTQQSWYLHDVIRLNDTLSVTVGARDLDIDTESRSTGFTTGEDDVSRDEEMYEGGLRFHFTDHFSAFAGAQRSVRIVNADEIAPGSGGALEPQTGRTYTAGATWKKDRQHSTLTLWQGRFEDEIIYDPSAGFFGGNVNLDDPTRRRGASLNSRWQLEEDLSLSFNGTYQRATFAGGQYEDNEVPLVPLQTAYLRADYDVTGWLRLSLAHRYVGKRYLDNDPANEARRLPSYRMSDAIVRAEWKSGFLEAGAYNFTDELVADYGIKTGAATYAAYPLPERNYRITLGLKL